MIRVMVPGARRSLRSRLGAGAAVMALACAAAPAALVVVTPGKAHAAEECGVLPLTGVQLCPTGDYPAGIVYTGVVGDVLLELDAAAQVLETVVLDATGDVSFLADGDTLITSDTGPGLIATAGDDVTLALDAVETTANGAEGVIVDAGGEVLVDVDSILTTGDASDALNIEADEGVTVTAGTLSTSGADSDGVELVSLSGPVSLDADLIETIGDASSGAFLRTAGDTDVNLSVLRTQGFEAVGLDLSVDPSACVLLIAGSCDSSFAIGELTTEGDGAIGALVRGAGNITADVGVLRTDGDEAAGLDLAADPDACVVLGAGNCGTSFVVDDLLTRGDLAPGVLVRGAGPITGDVGLIRTQGDDAAGLDLAVDPDACIVLGAGGCDIDVGGQAVRTEGDGAVGVLLRGAGDVLADFNLVNTSGDNANAIDIMTDPAVCLVLGAGSCGVTVGDGGGDVDTDGDGSDGVVVVTPGPVDVDLDDVQTDGDEAEGIRIVGGDQPIAVTVDSVVTTGADAEAIDVTGTGAISIDANTIRTSGPGSEGVIVDGGLGPIMVDVGAIDTAGAGADGVDITADGEIDVVVGDVDTTGDGANGVLVAGGAGEVTVDVGGGSTTGVDADVIRLSTTSGAQVITAGGLTADGAGSDGIEADSVSGDIAITVDGDITAAVDAVKADTGGAIDVTVAAGADVFGGSNGLELTSGTGTTITNNGVIDAGVGAAIDVDGAAAAIDNNGRIVGAVDLTDNDDTLVNDGVFDADGNSNFGAGVDLLDNNGTVRVRDDVTLVGLEDFNNDGLIDMIDGAADDSLTLPGDFSAGVDSELAVDVALGVDGTPADQLIIGGDVTGETVVTINPIGDGFGVLNPDGVVIVDTDGAANGSFTIGGPTTSGFVDYDIVVRDGDAVLVGLPGQAVFETVRAGALTQEFWYASADAIGAHMGHAARSPSGSGWWVTPFVTDKSHDSDREFTAFGVTSTRDLSYDQNHIGFQAGAEWGGAPFFFGVTGGYGTSKAEFETTGHELDLKGWNAGAYAGVEAGGFIASLLAKVDVFDADYDAATVPVQAEFDGKSWGAEGMVGYRFGGEAGYVQPEVSLAYVRTSLDGFDAAGASVDFEDAESLRGKAGVRAGWGDGAVRPFAALHAVHEFQGENGLTFSSGGFDLPIVDEPDETYGHAAIGADIDAGRADGFIQAEGLFGDVQGWGLRAGFRTRF